MSNDDGNISSMCVAWLANYPISTLASHLPVDTVVDTHPSSWVANLARALTRLQLAELHIVTLASKITEDYRIHVNNIYFHILRTPRYRWRLASLFQWDKRRLQAELDQIRPDIVHAHGTEGTYAYAAVTSKYPCVISIQGIITEYLKARKTKLDRTGLEWSIIQFLERYTIRRGRYFITRTAWDKAFVHRLCRNPVIFEIWEPMNECFFAVERVTTEAPKILFVGEITERKGVPELLEAFAIVLQEYPQVRMKLIGRFDDDYVKLLLRKQGDALKQAIEFCGLRSPEEIAREFRDAMMLILPSHADNSPNSVCEAMVAGVPVIASRVGGIPSVIKDREEGLLVEPRNVNDLADKMCDLLAHPEVRQRLAQRARLTARQRHAPENVAKQVYTAYNKILECETSGCHTRDESG